MTRKTANDFPPEVLKLFDGYVHGALSRRDFLDRAAKYAVGGFTAAAMLESLRPNFAWAQQIAKDDQRIKQAHRALIFKVLELFPKLYELKASAFREEREWRLVSMLVNSASDDCLFRSARTRIIPYRAFELADRGTPAIKEIVLGPRHETPPSVIQLMMKQAGFGEVPVRRSEATYR